VRLTGILHVSMPPDIIQLFGISSVPAIVAGSVLGVFELGERFASQRAKDALSKWLLTFDVQKANALPDGTQQLFERLFGERHFSMKCFGRSVAFSLGAMVFIAMLMFLVTASVQLYGISPLVQLDFWLPWSILIDYVSLFKTRVILRILTRMRRRNALAAVALVVSDYLVYLLLFSIGLALLILKMIPDVFEQMGLIEGFRRMFLATMPAFLILPRSNNIYSIFFWAGLAPSIWMWLYLAALVVTRGLLRSEKLVNWLRWALDVEKAPFRSIGAVAAALAFIASVAIILVSAEVSRITAVA
jgi:hypothetical protein